LVKNRKTQSAIRIIAGHWRGSRITVLDQDGLRPTPDRIRETVFNWLTSHIRGARVLDCCAGAGGLGLEAASRAATEVTLVELDRRAAAHLIAQCERLHAENVTVQCVDILDFLKTTQKKYDLVFIDPPYAIPHLRDKILQTLIENNLLNDECLLYLEWPKKQEMQLNHQNLIWIKQKNAGQVEYGVAQWRLSR
jgi:16S rRNA (guanine966-N2)-methyltransferase